jgi:hypothetical protein
MALGRQRFQILKSIKHSVYRDYSPRVLLLASVSIASFMSGRALAQDTAHAASAEAGSEKSDPASDPQQTPLNTTGKRWRHFVGETTSPLTLAGGTFNAAFSQVTDTDPRYGTDGAAFAERFGASIADIATQNFFGDFVVASALHEDPRYYRRGKGCGFWSRAGYAISRALVIRSDNGGNTFNFDNVFGSALSTGLSNLYYPPASRTGRRELMHFGIDVVDNGFVNLVPEFWPDFREKILRRHSKNKLEQN